MNISIHGVEKSERLRILIQIIASVIILGVFIFGNGGTGAIFFKLLAVSLVCILLSTLIVNRFSLQGVINSVVVNMAVAFVLFFAGTFLQEQFSFEQTEMSTIDTKIVGTSNEPAARVITASVVVFSGWEFFCLYFIHAIFAYLKFLKKFKTESQSVTTTPDKFFVKLGNKTHFIAYQDVYYVEASGNYLNIFDQTTKYVTRMPLNDWLTGSGKDYFIRVHRSFIININHISEMVGSPDGLPVLVLKNNIQVKLGKLYKEDVLRKLGV